jgi:tRNA threonylcarbamoyladenosine biosynthesis protein TsaE
MTAQPYPSSKAIPLDTEADTIALGIALAHALRPGALLVLDGQLGAGKTFLAGAIVHALGFEEDEPVTSPTYNLVSEYQAKYQLYHADLYRLITEDAVHELLLEERRSEGGVLLVEWGRPFIRVLGGDALILELNTSPRRATLQASGPTSADLVDLTMRALRQKA